MGRKDKDTVVQDQGPSEFERMCEGVTDAKNLQPVTLGVLRKEKIGNPFLALELFVMLIVVVASMGSVTESLVNPNGFLHKLVYKSTGVEIPGDDSEKTLTELNIQNIQKLTDEYVFKYGDLYLRGIKITDDYLEGIMYTKGDKQIDLDNKEYYLVIYPGSEKIDGSEVGAFKFVGLASSVEESFKYSLANVKFNSTMPYYGVMTDMDGAEYPKKELTPDAFGKANLVCTNEERTLTYTFKNDYLISLNDTFAHLHSKVIEEEEYQRDFTLYQQKAAKYGERASIEEAEDGFVYKCDIDLEDKEYKYPIDKDPEYYNSELSGESTDVSVIYYAMTGKGYDCK